MDKRAGQTDSLSSAVTCASGSSITFASGSSSTFQSGSTLAFQTGSTISGNIGTLNLTVNSGTWTFSGGTTLTFNGPVTSLGTFTVSNPIATISHSITRGLSFGLTFQSLVSSVPQMSVNSVGQLQQSDVTGAPSCNNPISLPHGATVTQIVTNMLGITGHTGLPSFMPNMVFAKVKLSTGVLTIIGTVTDSSSTTVAYQAVHPITLSGLSELVDNSTYTYLLAYNGESGSNALTGLLYLSNLATMTITSLTEA